MNFDHSSLQKMLHFMKSTRLSDLFSEDISFGEFGMLRLIAEIEVEKGAPEISESDIVKRVNVTPQAVSKFINLTSRKGLIERFENASDRRNRGIKLTENGRAVLRKSMADLSGFSDAVFSEFSQEERESLQYLMNKLYKVVQENYLKYKQK